MPAIEEPSSPKKKSKRGTSSRGCTQEQKRAAEAEVSRPQKKRKTSNSSLAIFFPFSLSFNGFISDF